MSRPRFSWLCAAIVVLLIHADRAVGAAALSEDVPLPGGTASLAHAFGVETVPDRGRFLYETARLLYNAPEGRKPGTEAFLQTLRQPSRAGRTAIDGARDAAGSVTEVVPIPLTTEVWSSAIFHRRIAPRDIVPAILADRSAALIALGLSSLDDDTLGYFADHPAVLERIYERSVTAFVTAAPALRIQNNRVVPPGGELAAPLWEALLVEKTSRPDRFLTQLFELTEGRLAYLYGVVGALDAPHRAFALGAPLASAAARLDRFKLLAASIGSFREAHLRTLPFGRATFDLSMTLMRVQVDENGVPRPPAARGFWSRIFAGGEADRGTAHPTDDDAIDAAWLSDVMGSADVRVRGERLDQMSFAQRVFASADASQRADVFTAVRALPRFRMLMWTIERMGIAEPETYAAAVRKATRISALEGRRAFEVDAQFQGALAIVARMRAVRAIDVARARALVDGLVALPLGDDGRYAGAVARWLREEIIRSPRQGETLEAAMLAAISGGAVGDGRGAPTVVWEGQPYRVDLGGAERRRLARVRERQEGVPLDVPLELAAAARVLSSGVDKVSPDDLQAMAGRLSAQVDDIPRRVGHEADYSPPGLAPAPNLREPLRRIVDDLARDVRSGDPRRAARAAGPLVEASDTLLAQSLMSIAYAADVGDPDGAVLLADDVSLRHDFGLAAKDIEMRQRLAWAVPHQEVNPGVPWHVSGAVVGLDIGLASLALRRLNYERVLEAPRLTSNERDAFALSVSLLNPFDLRDGDRDRIAQAVERGRSRVAAAIGNAAAFDRIADELSLEGWRRRAMRWMVAHESDRVVSMFSLTEVLILGGGYAADLHRWGMSMLAADGCPCSRLTPPARWPTLFGRPPLGLTATAVADLHLHVALMLRELRLPAALAKVVLSAAAQDFIDEVRPTDDADWVTLARAVRLVTRDRIEDYIAAAAASGPLMPVNGTGDGPR